MIYMIYTSRVIGLLYFIQDTPSISIDVEVEDLCGPPDRKYCEYCSKGVKEICAHAKDTIVPVYFNYVVFFLLLFFLFLYILYLAS